MLDSFFINMVTFISFLFFNGMIIPKLSFRNKNLDSVISGVTFGMLGLVLMHFSISLKNNTIVDLRHLAIIMSFIYSNPISGFITTVIIILGRLFIGFNSTSIIASIITLILSLVCYLISTKKITSLKKIRYANISSLILILLSLILNLKDNNEVLKLFPFHVLFSTLSLFLAYLIAEYINNYNSTYNKLKYTSSQLDSLLSNLNSGILAQNDHGKITYSNLALIDLFGLDLSPKYLVEKNENYFMDIIKYEFSNPTYFISTMSKVKYNKTLFINNEFYLKDGRTLEIDYIPINMDNQYKGHFWNFKDVTIRKNIELKLKTLSEIDGLTGISNRRVFDENLSLFFKQCKDSKTYLSLIMMDIDYFKLYNDNYGHLEGDQCLKKVAMLINELTKNTPFLAARYGGEEFVILMPHSNDDAALIISNSIKSSLEYLSIPHLYSKVTPIISLSIGISSILPNDNITEDSLIKMADEALYLAKRNGRNQIHIFK